MPLTVKMEIFRMGVSSVSYDIALFVEISPKWHAEIKTNLDFFMEIGVVLWKLSLNESSCQHFWESEK